ncbi:hypothetical protein BKA67DRAFT_662936 [Truncatella angustata]|uniref:Uncharacterized protein n=1 Tax=Truncatella angustata TaxID=152316 RepID=A0A9P8UCB8_9PEZI|nr:uncharacterized protein BKA67DRAFT_662936 [Truncatella angustata]KAH6646521.1 hypothetical protein BKA67DRAFT_662936 [Truncatella angustata]
MAISRFTDNPHPLSSPDIIYISDDSSDESGDEDYNATLYNISKGTLDVELDFSDRNSTSTYAASVSPASDNPNALTIATEFEALDDASDAVSATTSFDRDAPSTETFRPVVCSRSNSFSSSDMFTFEDTDIELA